MVTNIFETFVAFKENLTKVIIIFMDKKVLCLQSYCFSVFFLVLINSNQKILKIDKF